MEEGRLPCILGQRVEKTDKNKYGYVDVDLNDITINSPVVLCFGGSGVVGRSGANGLAKFVFNSLNTKPEQSNLKVYSLVYGSNNSSPMDGNLTEEEVELLADKIFMPLVSHNGQKIDVLKAQKNMRNITIVSHCFGMAVANILSSTVANKMLELDYTRGEVVSILKQVTHISYAPLKAKTFPLFSIIDFYSMQDEFSKYYKPKFEDKITNNFGAAILNRKENHLTLAINSVIGDIDNTFKPFDEHSIGILKRDENWKYFPKENFNIFSKQEQKKLLSKKHNVDSLFSRADMLSGCFAFCIAESVANSFKNLTSNKLEEVDLEALQEIMNASIKEQNEKESKNIVKHIKKSKTQAKEKAIELN